MSQSQPPTTPTPPQPSPTPGMPDVPNEIPQNPGSEFEKQVPHPDPNDPLKG